MRKIRPEDIVHPNVGEALNELCAMLPYFQLKNANAGNKGELQGLLSDISQTLDRISEILSKSVPTKEEISDCVDTLPVVWEAVLFQQEKDGRLNDYRKGILEWLICNSDPSCETWPTVRQIKCASSLLRDFIKTNPYGELYLFGILYPNRYEHVMSLPCELPEAG